MEKQKGRRVTVTLSPELYAAAMLLGDNDAGRGVRLALAAFQSPSGVQLWHRPDVGTCAIQFNGDRCIAASGPLTPAQVDAVRSGDARGLPWIEGFAGDEVVKALARYWRRIWPEEEETAGHA